MKKLGIAILVGVVLALVFLTAPMSIWDGSVPRPIKIAVRGRNGEVVSNASVMVIHRMDELVETSANKEEFLDFLKSSGHFFISDQQGRGTIIGRFGAGGGLGLFGRTGHFIADGVVVVSHPDFVDIRVPLQNFTQERRIPISKSELAFTVFLDRKKPSEPGSTGH